MAGCPDCKTQINEYEIKALIGPDLFEKLQQESMNAFMKDDQSIVRCNCGNVMEVKEGKVDYNQKDDQGKKLSREA